MTIKELRQYVVDETNDFYFDYNGENCGVEQTVKDSYPTYIMWYGDKDKEFHDFNTVVSDKFFDGKSIADLIDTLEIRFV